MAAQQAARPAPATHLVQQRRLRRRLALVHAGARSQQAAQQAQQRAS